MASHFEEERFSLGEKSERMVTVTPFMGKLKVHIRQFYVNGNGEIKPGKRGIVLEIEEFYKLVELIPQMKRSIESYELKDTVIPSSPFQLDLPVLDLDIFFYFVYFLFQQNHKLLQTLRSRTLGLYELDWQPSGQPPPPLSSNAAQCPQVNYSVRNKLV